MRARLPIVNVQYYYRYHNGKSHHHHSEKDIFACNQQGKVLAYQFIWYLPSSGKAKEVEGIISEMSRKNIVCDSKMLMHRAIFSPESAGK